MTPNFLLVLWHWLRRPPEAVRLVCVRQADTWCWPAHLGKQTPAICAECGEAIWCEDKHAAIKLKICAQCAGWWQ